MIPPGKHRFLIILDDKSVCVTRKISTARWAKILVNQFCMPLRELEISLSGEMTHMVSAVFDKNKSVFRYFLEDNETIIKASYDSDLKNIKIARFVKEYLEIDQLLTILSQNYSKLKSIFSELIIGKNYPYISKHGFISFCQTCEITSETLTKEKLESTFDLTDIEIVQHDENPKKMLCRYEFLEIILRIALIKFQDLEVPSFIKLQKLLDENIYKFSFFSKSRIFRKERMYNLEVNDILEKNFNSLQSLLNKYKDETGRWLSIKGAGLMAESAG